MASVDTPAMHEEFAVWYSAVSLGDDQARRQARWEGVSSVVEDANREMLEGLLRLAHQSRQRPAADVVYAVRQAFKATDNAFEMSGNDRELQILAGACLAVLMETDEDTGAAAALAATTAALGGGRQPDLPMDLAALGETAIVRWGEANRKRPFLTAQSSGEPPPSDLDKAAARVMEEESWESVSDGFKCVAATVRTVDHFLRVQDEELQMLWWLTGQRSSGYDRAFDAIPANARPLVLASELADKTEFLPGPPSVKGILSRAGLKGRKKVPITVAVNAANPEWLRGLLGDVDPSFVSTPLHAAIKRQLETGTGEVWIAGWAASTGVDAAYALSVLALGNLFYRERLLLLFG